MDTKERAGTLCGVLYPGEYCIHWEVTIFIYNFCNADEKQKQNDSAWVVEAVAFAREDLLL